jgi:hypothetical protein
LGGGIGGGVVLACLLGAAGYYLYTRRKGARKSKGGRGGKPSPSKGRPSPHSPLSLKDSNKCPAKPEMQDNPLRVSKSPRASPRK